MPMHDYECSLEGQDDDSRTYHIQASSPLLAAEQFMGEYEGDRAEYPVARGEETAIVRVVTAGGNLFRVVVEGDPGPHYFARVDAGPDSGDEHGPS